VCSAFTRRGVGTSVMTRRPKCSARDGRRGLRGRAYRQRSWPRPPAPCLAFFRPELGPVWVRSARETGILPRHCRWWTSARAERRSHWWKGFRRGRGRRQAQVHHAAANLALAEAGQYQVSGCLLAGAASAAEGAAAEPRLRRRGGLAQLHSQTPNPYTIYISLNRFLYVLISNFLRNSGLSVHCASWSQKCKVSKHLNPLHTPGDLHSAVQRRAAPPAARRPEWYFATGSLAHLHTPARQNPSVYGSASKGPPLLVC
jgi:hypothetical protein